MSKVKLVVYSPVNAADAVRDALAKSGAGTIGNYSNCSFSSKGIGRFTPQNGANPTIGEIGKLEPVEEERIEVTCEQSDLNEIIRSMKNAHPYEEVAYEIY